MREKHYKLKQDHEIAAIQKKWMDHYHGTPMNTELVMEIHRKNKRIQELNKEVDRLREVVERWKTVYKSE